MEPPPAQRTFKAVRLGEWNEQAYQLWMDALTLRSLIDCLDDNSLRRHRVEQAMMDVTTVVDPEAAAEQFDSAIPAARSRTGRDSR